jgi:NAD(P)-dependent dehydrogenase (short-subunit alcohol dehydrogenase family)
VADLNAEHGAELVKKHGNDKVVFFEVDVTNESSVKKAVEGTVK